MFDSQTARVPGNRNTVDDIYNDSRELFPNSHLPIEDQGVAAFFRFGGTNIQYTVTTLFNRQPNPHDRKLVTDFAQAFFALRWMGFSRKAALEGAAPQDPKQSIKLPAELALLVKREIPSFPLNRVSLSPNRRYAAFPWWGERADIYSLVDEEFTYIIGENSGIPKSNSFAIIAVDGQESAPRFGKTIHNTGRQIYLNMISRKGGASSLAYWKALQSELAKQKIYWKSPRDLNPSIIWE
jgi:hypothetical protein